MAGVSTQITDENKVIGEVSYSFEIVINRPAKYVWPHLLNFGSWIEDFTWVHISGERNKVGEITYLYNPKIPVADQDKELGTVKTLDVIPERLTHHVNPLHIDANGGVSNGNNVVTLNEFNGKTKVTYIGNKQYILSQGTKEELHESLLKFNKDVQQRFEGQYLPRLKELAEM